MFKEKDGEKSGNIVYWTKAIKVRGGETTYEKGNPWLSLPMRKV